MSIKNMKNDFEQQFFSFVQMCSLDKDFRFMATNDLMNELQKDSIKLDDESERKVVRMVLKLLEDKNGEVQNLAVKCLGPLVNKVKEFQVETIVDTLCTNMVSEKEQLRDISSIGLKTVISELPLTNQNMVANVCRRITGRLSSAIEKKEDVSVQLEALDILADLLSRFGSLIVAFQTQILNALLPQLCSPRQAVRKRTIVALGYFVLSCNPQMYSKIVEHLLESLSASHPTANSTSSTAFQTTHRTYIQCMAAICRQAGHRFGEHMERIVPVVITYSQVDDEELREYCLQAFEAFVHRCPKEITPYIPAITDLCLKYMTYDPNYNYDSEDEDHLNETDSHSSLRDVGSEDSIMETEDECGEEEENDEYSDDDDMSWKVRRSAAKCLEAIILTRHELIAHFYKYVSPSLIARFKEREENVKSDIFHAYIALLRQTKPVIPRDNEVATINHEEASESPITLLQIQVPDIVRAVYKLMRDKSIKTRQDCFLLLKELLVVMPGALSNHIETLIPGIQYSLGDKNSSSNMKIDTLNFIHCLITTHTPGVFHPHMDVLMPPIVSAVGDSFYKITAEALNVLQEMVKVIRPLEKPIQFNFTTYTDDLYKCTLMRLRAQDIDQEVKERAISCMGQILCNLGDYLQSELSVCLPIFLDRLKNEITRLTTVKALNKVAASPLKIDLRGILEDAVPILGSFLRKNQRSLKLAALTLLDTLIRNYSTAMTPELLQTVVIEMPPLINEADLHIAQLTLTLLTSICELQPRTLISKTNILLPEIVTLVKSPLLQGIALQAMLDFFQTLEHAHLPGLQRADLLYLLVEQATCSSSTGSSTPSVTGIQKSLPVLHKQAFHSLAKCVAAVTISDRDEALVIVGQFLKELQEPDATDAHQIFALFVVGEIGRHIDLSSVSDLKQVILNSFTPSSEEIKSAASYALGSVAIGNLPLYIPFILKEIESQPKRQYLLLHSLKEVITCMSSSPSGVQSLMHFIPAIWTQLFKHCECSEEGTRNVVAECLGKLTLINPQDLLPRLQTALNSPSPLMRTTIVTAVKFTISDQPQPIDPLLRMSMIHFLQTLQDPDLNVRRVALVAFNSAAHNKPSLVRDLLEFLLPQLYEETKIKKELIRELEMGPFKHTVDDGLDIRKAAFECMYTLLDTCLDRLDIFEFLNHVEGGLKDHYDIKMLTYLMVARLSQLCPSTVLQRLDRLVEPLKATCTLKVKANSVKQEYEKQDELKRSAMRAVAALYSIPDADKNPFLTEFMTHVKTTMELQAVFESIQKESHQSLGHFNLLETNQMDQS